MSAHKAQTTNSALKQAESLCSSRGTRLTEKRKQVLTGLLESRKALSAYELTAYCRNHLGSELPAMSVYRILEFLEGESLVHRLDLAKKYVACSHILCEHKHELPQFLICKACYKVQEISIRKSLIDSLNQSVKGASFRLASQQLEFDCFCEDCYE